jgi:TPR repeat protein
LNAILNIQSLLSRLSGRERAPTLARAEDMYVLGRHAEAAVLFRALAQNDSIQAQIRLAQLYERGEGVLQSFVEAVSWFRGAALQGAVPAMTRLGAGFSGSGRLVLSCRRAWRRE